MLGPRPSRSRPDAQAAWDHARHQADRYLACRLHHLDDQQLADLDRRMRAVIADRPRFDPAQLEDARRALTLADRTWPAASPRARPEAAATRDRARRRIDTLERTAHAHRRWRAAADEAAATLRQIRLEQHQRKSRRPSTPTRTRSRTLVR